MPITREQHLREIAVGQILGYQHAKSGYSFRALIEAMDLSAEEWAHIRRRESRIIPEDDVADINQYYRSRKDRP